MRNGNSTKLQLVQNGCYWLVFLSKLQLNRKFFTLLLAESNFTFLLSVCNFRRIIFNYSFFYLLRKTFQVSDGTFQFLRFCFSDSNFQVSVGIIKLSPFCFSGFSFSSFCWKVPIFTLRSINTAGLGLN